MLTSKLFLVTILFSPLTLAALHDLYSFDSLQKKNQFEQILYEMRCLVCQNQNLADSNAPLAKDLRLVIYQRLQNKQSKEKIKKYLVSRYGDFISFKPTFSLLNYCLWLSPFILLIVILLIFLFKIKKK
ncbi:MAG: cytochrome c-type biogenesis protein CcmH [Gammaproteobacteria bacterium]|nr:MAG: cytochrome c-type biogenesis protein CcmH [Gammaproteobacteria bacterium]